jgi:hypothetical protein
MKFFRISLRSLFIVTALVAMTFAWVVWQRSISAKQDGAIAWLDRNNFSESVDGRAPGLYIETYQYCTNANGTRDRFLWDDVDAYVRPIIGQRYFGVDRLRLICDENFAFNSLQIERLFELVDLKTISLFAYTLTDDQLLRLSELPNVENLLLSGAFLVTDESAVHIARMTELYELEISGSKITDKTLLALCNCRKLREIALDGNDAISYEGARKLRDSLKPVRFNVSRCSKMSIEQQHQLNCYGPAK